MRLVTEHWVATIFLEAACWIGEPRAAAKFASVICCTGSRGFRVGSEIKKYIEFHREVTYIDLRLGQSAPRWKVGALRNG